LARDCCAGLPAARASPWGPPAAGGRAGRAARGPPPPLRPAVYPPPAAAATARLTAAAARGLPGGLASRDRETVRRLHGPSRPPEAEAVGARSAVVLVRRRRAATIPGDPSLPRRPSWNPASSRTWTPSPRPPS